MGGGRVQSLSAPSPTVRAHTRAFFSSQTGCALFTGHLNEATRGNKTPCGPHLTVWGHLDSVWGKDGPGHWPLALSLIHI